MIVIAIIATLICGLLCMNTWVQSDAVLNRIEQLEKNIMEGQMTSTWISGRITRSITTPRLPNEGVTEWAKRHDAEVNKMLQVFPVDDAK